MQYHDLNAATRFLMHEEMTLDQQRGVLYLSKRLTGQGEAQWPDLLREAIVDGDDASLARDLRQKGRLETHEVAFRNGRPHRRKVPQTAPETLAEGEFNRFYCRGVCRRALGEGGEVEVYRAKHVRVPRPESERLIGRVFDAQTLLDDLRGSIGVDTALGVPAGPNSGLSVRLVEQDDAAQGEVQ